LSSEEPLNLDELYGISTSQVDLPPYTPNVFINKKLERILKKINPNLPYVFTEEAFIQYLRSKDREMEDLLVDVIDGDLDYLSINLALSDNLRTEVKKFMGLDKEIWILYNKSGKLGFRSLFNKEAFDLARKIVGSLSEYEQNLGNEYDLTQENLDIFQEKINEIEKERKKYLEILKNTPKGVRRIIIHGKRKSIKYLEKEIDRLEKKLYGGSLVFE